MLKTKYIKIINIIEKIKNIYKLQFKKKSLIIKKI